VLALAAVNAVGAAAFAAIYGAAALRGLSQGAFLAALVVVFVALTAVWLRVERTRPGDRDWLARIGRAAGGLVIGLVAAVALVLTPLFALRAGLPAEASDERLISGVMVILLIAMVLVVLANIAGSATLAVLARRARRHR
jgi:hypothetical protein